MTQSVLVGSSSFKAGRRFGDTSVVGPIVLAVLVLASLVLARRGSWWAAAMPAALCVVGVLLYLPNAGDLAEYEDGYWDKFAAIIFMLIGAPWLVIVVVIMLVVRARRRPDGVDCPS